MKRRSCFRFLQVHSVSEHCSASFCIVATRLSSCSSLHLSKVSAFFGQDCKPTRVGEGILSMDSEKDQLCGTFAVNFDLEDRAFLHCCQAQRYL